MAGTAVERTPLSGVLILDQALNFREHPLGHPSARPLADDKRLVVRAPGNLGADKYPRPHTGTS
jgi:hypothetical protein